MQYEDSIRMKKEGTRMEVRLWSVPFIQHVHLKISAGGRRARTSPPLVLSESGTSYSRILAIVEDAIEHILGSKYDRSSGEGFTTSRKGSPWIRVKGRCPVRVAKGGVDQTPRIECSRKSAKRRAPAKHPLLISDPQISIPRYVDRENATESLLTNSAVGIAWRWRGNQGSKPAILSLIRRT